MYNIFLIFHCFNLFSKVIEKNLKRNLLVFIKENPNEKRCQTNVKSLINIEIFVTTMLDQV